MHACVVQIWKPSNNFTSILEISFGAIHVLGGQSHQRQLEVHRGAVALARGAPTGAEPHHENQKNHLHPLGADNHSSPRSDGCLESCHLRFGGGQMAQGSPLNSTSSSSSPHCLGSTIVCSVSSPSHAETALCTWSSSQTNSS